MEIFVADVLKSLIIYQVDYDDPMHSIDPEIGESTIKSPSSFDRIKDGI